MLFEQFIRKLDGRKLLFQASEHSKLLIQGVYSGFDPTSKSLHVGNLIPILGLIFCGQNNVEPYALLGSATALIGDPTGRKLVKEVLSETDISYNASMISKQIEKIYNKGIEMTKPETFKPIKFVDNLIWFRDIRFLDFLTEVGRSVKVNSMLSRNCVQSRLGTEDGLTFCELSYQLMQGYDFYYLNKRFGVNVQMGGSDQWGNMISGTDFINKKLNKDAAFVTLPLLTTSNGVKMGKSSGNGIWLDSNMTCIYDFYQYFVSLSDADVHHILPLLNLFDPESIAHIINDHNNNPSRHILQKYLSKYMTSFIHGSEIADQVENFSNTLFSQKPTDFSTFRINEILDCTRLKKITRSSLESATFTALEFLKLIFPEHSNSQLRNFIKSGSFKLNFEKINDTTCVIRTSDLSIYNLVNIGKSSFYVIQIEN